VGASVGSDWLPLHPFQEGILLDQARDFLDPRYNTGGCFRMPAGTDAARLIEALMCCSELNESLRIRVGFHGETPALRFATDLPPVHRLLLPDEDAALAYMQARMVQPFDLRRDGPVADFSLVELADGGLLLFIRAHHIAIDQGGFRALMASLDECYRGAPAATPSYADRIVSAQAYLRSAEYAKDQCRWQTWLAEHADRLGGAFPAIAATETGRGRSVANLSQDHRVGLERLSGSLGVSRVHVSLAALSVCLAGFFRQLHFIAGMPVHGRVSQRDRRLVGPLVNVVPSMIRYDPAITVAEFLSGIRNEVMRDLRLRAFPMHRLQRLFRAAGRRERYAFCVAVTDFPADTAVPFADGIAMGTPLDAQHELLPLHLIWRANPGGGPSSLEAEYSRSAFTPELIDRLLQAFADLILQFSEKLSDPVSSLQLVAAETRRHLLSDLGDAPPTPPRATLVHSGFEAWAQREPDRLALVQGDCRISYGALNARANRIAHLLIRSGVGLEDRVAVCVNRGPEMIAAVLGVLKAGAAYVPLDPAYPAQRLAQMLDDSAPALLITQEALQDRFSSHAVRRLSLDAATELLAGVPCDNPIPVAVHPANLAYVIYTSGSTGRPKGVAMSHGAVCNLLAWHQTELPATAEVALQFAALGFDVAFQEILTTLVDGGSLVLLDESERRDPVRLLRLLGDEGVTRAFLPPSAMSTLAQAARRGDTSALVLRDVICAGEPLKIDDEIRALCAGPPTIGVHNHYGPTESHVVAADRLAGLPPSWPALPRLGVPVANSRIYLLDPDLRLSPLGQIGEIYIGGPGLARGYLGRPAATAERFLADPYAGGPGARMYRTGDLGRWDADGRLEFLGRCDNQVKLRGHRVELQDVEAALEQLPAVAEAVVSVQADPGGEARLIAHIRPAEGVTFNAAAIREAAAASLPPHMVAAAFVRVDAWPLSVNGKIDRLRLPAPDRDDTGARDYAPPVGETETVIAGIWCDVIGLDRVGRHDEFFELGGHSLHAVRIAMRMSDLFGTDLEMSLFSREPTVALLAEAVVERTLERFDAAEVARLQAQIEAMSPDELESLLAK
jgi:amino acid adenylation domain-containing protein